MFSSWQNWAMRVGPSRLISIADVSGESNETVAAEWMTMSAVAKIARSPSLRPSPSVPTSPAMVVIRRSVIAANDSPSGSAAWSARSRSKASFLKCQRLASELSLTILEEVELGHEALEEAGRVGLVEAERPQQGEDAEPPL